MAITCNHCTYFAAGQYNKCVRDAWGFAIDGYLATIHIVRRRSFIALAMNYIRLKQLAQWLQSIKCQSWIGNVHRMGFEIYLFIVLEFYSKSIALIRFVVVVGLSPPATFSIQKKTVGRLLLFCSQACVAKMIKIYVSFGRHCVTLTAIQNSSLSSTRLVSRDDMVMLVETDLTNLHTLWTES